MLSPRLGFNYDAFGDRSLVVRGGTGIFTGRVPFVWLTNMPTTMGVIQNTIETDYAGVSPWIDNIRFQPDDIYHWVENPPAGGENVFIKNPKDAAPGSIALVDDHFKMPSVWRTSIGADYKIPNSPVTLTADFLYTRDVNAVFQHGMNRKASSERLDNAGDNREYYSDGASYTYNDKLGANSAVLLTNTNAKGHALSATFGATVAPWHGLSGSLFYTYSSAKEQSNNPGSAGVSAWANLQTINNPNDANLYYSNFAMPHRVVASLNYTFQNSTIGIFYNGSSQGRYSYVYNGDVNHDGIRADLMYLPETSADVNFVDIVDKNGNVLFDVADQREALDNFIAKNGLESYRGKYLGRNEFLLPWLNRIDLRFTQNVFKDLAKKGDKIQFTLDVVNVGNLLNKNWGVQDVLLGSGTSFLNVVDNKTNKPTFNMATDGGKLVENVYRNASSFSSTWSAVLGVRYSF